MELPPFQFYRIGALLEKGEATRYGIEVVCDAYQRRLQNLKKGEESKSFVWAMSTTPDAFSFQEIEGGKLLVRPMLPVVQLNPHALVYSSDEAVFRSSNYGVDQIDWGVQFSYPQLYQDPETKEILSTKDPERFPNTPLFRTLQKWVRHHTRPTPFLVEGKKIVSPVRLGSDSFSWIGEHPGLQKRGIDVVR